MKTLNDCVVNKINENSFTITAKPKTDYFIDPASDYNASNAPYYFDAVEYDFIASVKIKPDFKSTYDAGAIIVFDDKNKWIKIAFELTDLGYPSVVTVVTKNTSDDSNGEQIKENAVYLRILRRNKLWSVHYSLDSQKWKMIRYFELDLNRKVNVGVVAQSPIGTGCTVEFTDLKIANNNCKDMRKGE